MIKSKAREILDKDRDFILWLFDNRCVRCGFGRGITIHEILPISHGGKSLRWKNRVVLCMNCHEWAHGIGTRNSIPILQEKRKEFLIRKFQLDVGEYEQDLQKDQNRTEISR